MTDGDGASRTEAGPRFWSAPEGALPPRARFVLTTRRGGVSEGPFATLNMGLRVGDRDEAVQENLRRVHRSLGMRGKEPVRIRQVHGTALVPVSQAGSAADGFLLRSGDPWAAVSVADCAPVALVTEDGTRGAIVHSGWRGTLEGIAVKAAEILTQGGAPRAGLHVMIGPCIHACCYPVGPETARLFPTFLLRPHPSGRLALDLPGAIAASLTSAGLAPGRIAAAAECTACSPEWFYSHRRDRGRTGRHWGLLRLAPARR